MNKKNIVFSVLVFILIISLFCSQDRNSKAGYDARRDPFNDLSMAIDASQRTGQRILLEVGGEWCKWCQFLENFIRDHRQVQHFLQENFILVKVNYSPENKNEAFLSRYPQIPGYPHFFVLDSDGTFLHSQGTEVLEAGQSYDPDRVMEFLRTWAPAEKAK